MTSSNHLMLDHMFFLGFSGVSESKESVCQCRRARFDPWVRKIPWRRKWLPTPVLLPGKSRGQRSLMGYSPGSCKELDMMEHACNTHVFPSKKCSQISCFLFGAASQCNLSLHSPPHPTHPHYKAFPLLCLSLSFCQNVSNRGWPACYSQL